MARAAPNEEQVQLRRRARRRLIGAIALAIVIAVVLPWVLESEPPPGDQEIAIQIPSLDTGSFDPRTDTAQDAAPKPADDGKPQAEQQGADGALEAEQQKVLAAPAKGAPEKAAADQTAAEKTAAEKAAPKEKSAAEPRRSTAEKADTRQFVVQIAALADADKAREIQQELAARGLRAYTERIKAGNGEVTRVRVGPFPSREAAEKERARLKSLGFEGNVAPR